MYQSYNGRFKNIRAKPLLSQMRRMSHLDVLTPQNEHLLRLRYQYDKVGNVLSLENNANILNNGMGGLFYHNYSYDKLNRLASANGDFVGQPTNPESDYQSTYGTRLTIILPKIKTAI